MDRKMKTENGLKVYSSSELSEILELHKKWLKKEEGGIKADLSHCDLRNADLSSIDLRQANLSNSNLGFADLGYANLSFTDLNHADLKSANLNSANLSFADLNFANLAYANLRYAIGNMKHVKTLQLEGYMISYTDTILAIGCKLYPITDWENFSDEFIAKLDEDALEWWKKWKTFIFQVIKLSPAEPTGFEIYCLLRSFCQ